MSVSVVIPCFSQGRYLPECVKSLQDQSLAEWEAIIVDDGSPDDTRSIALQIAQFEPRVQVISQENRGLAGARNAGLQVCKGTYVQFLDADDLIAPLKLAAQTKFLDANPNVDIIYGNAWYFDDENHSALSRELRTPASMYDWIRERAVSPGSMVTKLVWQNCLPVCAALIRREACIRQGAFNESLRALEDWEFWYRCTLAGATFRFVDEKNTECLIRVHRSSVSWNSGAMVGGEIQMRLLMFSYTECRQLRAQILAAAGGLLKRVDHADRERLCVGLMRAATCLSERIAVLLGFWLGPGARLHRIAKPILRIMPWRIGMMARP